MGIHPTKGFLIAGPVGSGKTFLANCILSYLKNCLNFNAYSINGGLLTLADAEQSIKKIFDAAR
jgi:SpoVK/Ycf46/Vps4 family AAA+-type ATPase